MYYSELKWNLLPLLCPQDCPVCEYPDFVIVHLLSTISFNKPAPSYIIKERKEERNKGREWGGQLYGLP
jgi:hypothetical protein